VEAPFLEKSRKGDPVGLPFLDKSRKGTPVEAPFQECCPDVKVAVCMSYRQARNGLSAGLIGCCSW
jgi:hypothetical protein